MAFFDYEYLGKCEFSGKRISKDEINDSVCLTCKNMLDCTIGQDLIYLVSNDYAIIAITECNKYISNIDGRKKPRKLKSKIFESRTIR
jgi:ribosomal protein L24E